MTSIRVLLLEDDLALRGLLVEALAAEGIEARSFDGIVDARQAAFAGEGDMLIADFWGGSQRTLPDDERAEIRELCSYLPVILLTGRTWAADTTAQELGARALMRKPFDLDELLDAVERAMAELQA